MAPAYRLAAALAIVVGIAGSTRAAAAAAPQPASRPATQPMTISDEMAYALGAAVGRRVLLRIQEDTLVVNTDQIIKGLADALQGKPAPYSQSHLDELVAKVEQAVRTRWAEEAMASNPSYRKMAEQNLKDSRAALATLAKIEGVETLANGTLVKILKEGDGPYIANATQITANFKVALADFTPVKSTEAGKPEKVPASRLLPALRDALHGMKVGTLCRVALPPDLAYGPAGKPPVIGPNQALLFEIEVVAAE